MWANFDLSKGCTYDKVLRKVKQQKNALITDKGVTNCLSKVEELGALLALGDDQDAMEAKIDSICDEAIGHSRTDDNFVVDFETISLIDDDDRETVSRFLKEYYDGGE